MRQGTLVILLAIFLALIFVLVFSKPVPEELVLSHCKDCSRLDALQIALTLGRVDAISIALTFLGIGVGFFALFSYFSLREDAELAVQRAAKKIESDIMKSDDFIKLVDYRIRELQQETLVSHYLADLDQTQDNELDELDTDDQIN